jgi:porin
MNCSPGSGHLQTHTEQAKIGKGQGKPLTVSACLIVIGSGNLARAASPTADIPQAGLTPAIDASTAVSEQSPSDLDNVYGLKGWNIHFPSFGDALLQDDGGFRSTLAQYGIGFIAYDLNLSAVNVLDTPRTNHGRQAYWGQTPSDVNVFNLYVTYDLGKFGFPNGQLQIAGSIIRSTWDPYYPDSAAVYRLAYYQTFLNNKFEMNIGYIVNGLTFVGTYVGGQLQSPFGPSASIPTELGIANGAAGQPTAWFGYHLPDNLYDKFGIARSISPTASSILDYNKANPSGLNISAPGAGGLYINELGYERAAVAGDPFIWVRGGGVYNTSRYHDYATGGVSSNFGLYALADVQIWQASSASRTAAGRGLYLGVSAMYAAPETNIFTQYYETRLYALGPFNARPKDTVSLVYNHQVLSGYFDNAINKTAHSTGTLARDGSNSITASYTLHLVKGIYLSGGLGYTDHPSATYISHEGSALNLLGSLFSAF